MIFRAGFALNIIGSFVNGLMPLRCFVPLLNIRASLFVSGGKASQRGNVAY